MKSGEDNQKSKEDTAQLTRPDRPHNEVRRAAMGIMGLLRKDKKKALQQVKQLVKMNKEMAYTVLTCDVDGWTPVHACALRGSKKLLKTMLQAGIPVNCRMGQPEGLPGECTLLHIAANRMDKKVLDYLLHHGADVNARDSDGNTSLFYAKQANKDSVRLLISCGALLDDTRGRDYRHHHHQPQSLCVSDTTRQLHRSSPNLKEDQSQSLKVDKYLRFQQPAQQHWQKEKSLGTATSISSTTGIASTAKSHFLTVPPTKPFASSPCLLHQDSSSASNGNIFPGTTTSSSSSVTCPHHSKARNAENKKPVNSSNNNILSVTDLNSGSRPKGSSHCERAGSEGRVNTFSSHLDQNNSD